MSEWANEPERERERESQGISQSEKREKGEEVQKVDFLHAI